MLAIWPFRSKEWPWALFTIALAVRLGFVAVQAVWAPFDVPWESSDGVAYRGIANGLLRGEGFAFEGRSTAYVTPGYPAFLALVFLVSDSPIAVAVAQSFLGAATAVLVGRAAALHLPPPAGLVAGGLTAIYPGIIFWTAVDMTETLYLFFVAVAAYALAKVLASPSPQGGVLAGLAVGVGTLVRPPLLVAALGILACGVFMKRFRAASGVALVLIVAVIGAWVVRNAIVIGAPTIATESGIVLYQGHSPGATGGTDGYVGAGDVVPLDLPSHLSEAEIDQRYRSAAIDWILSNPGEALRLAPKKLWNMLRPTFGDASRINAALTLASYLPLLALAAFGFLTRARRSSYLRLIGLAVLLQVGLHMLITGMIRFRLPIELLLMIPAAAGIVHLASRAPAEAEGAA